MKILKSRNYNFDAAVKAIILLGYAVFFIVNIENAQILDYLHPRYIKFLKFGAITMILIALILAREFFKPQRILTNIITPLIFAVPLILAYIVPANSVDTTLLSNILPNQQMSYGDLKRRVESRENLKFYDQDKIVLDDLNYVYIHFDIYANLDKYRGKDIEMEGFVLKPDYLPEDYFIPARNFMACCVADMQTIGLLSRYEQLDELEDGLWVKVKGEIKVAKYKNAYIPAIEVKNIEEIEKPKIEYVYAW